MHVLGITGGICSGKSTAANLLVSFAGQLNVVAVDADKLGHQAYTIGTACYDKIVSHFGSDVVASESDEIDRKALGSIVFSNPQKMKELQEIVWPEIRSLLADKIRKSREQGDDSIDVLVVEAAVMIEAGWQDLMDTLWVVAVDPAVAIQRLMQRNSLNEEDAHRRIESQLSNEERCQYADLVIQNNFVDGDPLKTTAAFEESIKLAFEEFKRINLTENA